ncbi:MAG: Crp/Fnr family transcriptional regulator [Candidatus Magasanikbacteria bacterium]|nr:Crp/Fnr family transcriptional regulator [Candidatus Magasanikbacteria bacterium]
MFILGDGQKLIASFFAPFRPLRYKKGEIILRPDNLNPRVNFVEKGHIKVYSITEEGNEKLHLIFKSFALFPLLWVFKDIIRDVYYEAMDEVVLKKSTKEDFVKFIDNDSGALRELVDRVLVTMDVYVDRIDELEYIKSYPRLVSCLLTFAKHFGKKIGKTVLVDVPLTHRDIASSINMTRETVSRELEILINKKLIAYKKHLIVIKDPIGLRRELSSFPSDEGV